MTFQDLALAEPVLRAVEAEGYSIPTPIQAQAVPFVMEGRDLLGTAQTGTGKTAAFALPILHRLLHESAENSHFRKPRVLVISPTRELATQIGDSFRTYGRHTGLREIVVFGGVSQVPQVRALRRGVDILVATPGRLLDLFNQGCLKLDAVNILVLDEADRMLDMGFMPDIRRIVKELPRERQTLLFSATMPREIERLAAELLNDPAQVRIAPVAATTDLVTQSVCHVSREQKPNALAAYLSSSAIERAVVFTRTKQSADRVARRLQKAGISADAIHGNKTQNARQRTLSAFKSNRVTVLVATDVAARGLDVDGVSHVVNYDLPMEPETYVHRIGRTGRAGATGVAISFCDGEQRRLLSAIERLLKRKLPIEQIEAAQETSALALPSSAPQPREPHPAPPPRQSPPPRGEGREGGPRRDERPSRFEGRRERAPHREGGFQRREGGPRREGGSEGRRPERREYQRPAGEHRRPEGRRPYGRRPEGGRPQGGHAEGARPEGARPEGRRPEPRPAERPPRTAEGHSRPAAEHGKPHRHENHQRPQRIVRSEGARPETPAEMSDNVARKRKFFSKRRKPGFTPRPGSNGSSGGPRRPHRPGGENR